MTAQAIPTREDVTAAWLLLGDQFDVGRALDERQRMIDTPSEWSFTPDFDAHPDFDDCGCDDCIRKEAVR